MKSFLKNSELSLIKTWLLCDKSNQIVYSYTIPQNKRFNQHLNSRNDRRDTRRTNLHVNNLQFALRFSDLVLRNI